MSRRVLPPGRENVGSLERLLRPLWKDWRKVRERFLGPGVYFLKPLDLQKLFVFFFVEFFLGCLWIASLKKLGNLHKKLGNGWIFFEDILLGVNFLCQYLKSRL